MPLDFRLDRPGPRRRVSAAASISADDGPQDAPAATTRQAAPAPPGLLGRFRKPRRRRSRRARLRPRTGSTPPPDRRRPRRPGLPVGPLARRVPTWHRSGRSRPPRAGPRPGPRRAGPAGPRPRPADLGMPIGPGTDATAPRPGASRLSLQQALYGALTSNPDLVALRQGNPSQASAEAVEVARHFPVALNPTVFIDYRPITLIPSGTFGTARPRVRDRHRDDRRTAPLLPLRPELLPDRPPPAGRVRPPDHPPAFGSPRPPTSRSSGRSSRPS